MAGAFAQRYMPQEWHDRLLGLRFLSPVMFVPLLEVTYQEPYYLLEFEKSKQPQAEVNQVLAQEGWTLFAMEEIEMSLEEIFVKLTRDSEEEL